METRANYVVIGLCTVIGVLVGLGLFIWLAKWQSDRQWNYYDVYFDNVSGLSRASEVRFSGLGVGQVSDLELAGDGTGRVRVRLEVDANTPIREGASAQLQAQGVTGVSVVSITQGDAAKPLLRETTDGIPVLPGQRSVVQSLTEDAPDLLQESIKLVKEFQNLVGGQNQAYVDSILGNIDRASGDLETALRDFSAISRSVADATGQISVFTNKLDPIATSIDGALGEAKTTMTAMSGAFGQAQTTLATADTTLKSVNSVAQGADTVLRTDAGAAIAELKAAIVDMRGVVNGLGGQGQTVLASFGGTADRANARLDQLEKTIATLQGTLTTTDTTLASIDAAATSFTGLVDGDGAALVSEARTTLEAVNRSVSAVETAATQDVPAILADVRRAITGINATIDQVSGDVRTLSGNVGPAVLQATATMQDASATFRQANATLQQLEPVIAAAEGTFRSAEQVMSTDIAPVTADLRASAERMSSSIDAMAADIPGITAELRQTLERANATVAQINGIVQGSAGPIGDFTSQGLPQFVRFTGDARDLIARLDRIAAQLERDPARFFLGAQAPDFRR